MPSFKELAKSAHRTLCRCLATIILSFCGISSFGMISIKGILGLGTAATLSLAILTAASTPAFADQTSKSLDVNLTLGNSISVRILDSTATSDLSLLSFDLTPTAAGVTSTKRAIVDVSTSNITGYKLYVEANGKDHNNQYTTDLVQGDTADSHVIPTSTSTSSNKNFWNYVNPATSSATVVPAHGNPDQIGYLLEPTTSTKSNVDINVGVDTTITAGSYTNQLLFTAIANAESIGYTLSFDLNGGSEQTPGDYATRSVTAAAASYTFTLPTNPPLKTGYSFNGFIDEDAEPGEKGSVENPYLPGENVTVYADPSTSTMSGSLELVASWTIINSTLTVDPNGGTWSGSTSTQTFPGDYGDTKVIANPSASYTISYNDNSQGATYSPNPPAPTSINRAFIGWSLTATGGGSPSGSFDTTTNTYTYNIASDTLTAGYNTTSDTFNLPQVTKTGHTCTWHEGSASGTSHTSGEANVTISANTEFYVVCTVNQYTLTVNPNGGTWGGSTSSQNFSQNYGTTKTISNPTAGAKYTITYNDNGQGATYTASPTSANRSFTSWSLSGSGTFVGGTYTYAAGNGTLTAQYSTTSDGFKLPIIMKDGYTCKWAKGSASGTKYVGGAVTPITITEDTTFYAVCETATFASISYMQEMTGTICDNVGIGSSAQLVDIRENVHKDYLVVRLNDGNCWMTESLRLNASTGIVLTPDDSDVSSSFTLQNTDAQWCADNTDECINAVHVFDGIYGALDKRKGYMYNWYAATAGTGTRSMASGADATSSICPKGWRLPRNSEYVGLREYYDTAEKIQSPNPNFVSEGFYGWYATESRNAFFGVAQGYYWSSTATATVNQSWTLAINPTANLQVNPYNFLEKYRGTQVRCIANVATTNLVPNITGIPSTSTSTAMAVKVSGSSVNGKKISVRKGRSVSITVTPATGVYLDSVTCPTGFTCSGYSTGQSHTEEQTITVTNNSVTSGDLDLTITPGYLPAIASCESSVTGAGFYADATTGYKKLADGNCYTMNGGSNTWSSAMSTSPAGATLPTKAEFENLITIYGSDGALKTATGWVGPAAWSSTEVDSNTVNILTFTASSAGIETRVKTNTAKKYYILRTPSNITQMQQMQTSVCNAMNVGGTKTLTDVRDDNTYTVAKLADENCWMTENLRLVGPLTITSSNSDIASGKSFSVPASTDPSVTPWCTEDAASCTDKAIMYDSGNSDYGAYYNWYTATASSGTYDTPTAQGIAQESICPKGWRLPTTFSSITSRYTTLAELTTSPVNLQLAGGIASSSGIMRDQGQQAYYWTSYKTDGSEQFARNARILWLRIEPEVISPTSYWGLLKGLSVRCIAR